VTSESATSPTAGASRKLAQVLAGTSFEDLPDGVIGDVQRSVLDWLGSTMAGAVEAPARIMQRVVGGMGKSEQATVFAAGRAAAGSAALANGTAAHILELDDVHKSSTLHPGAPIISAALAVAEREHATGKAFLLSVALGYDAALRIGEAVNPSHYRFWHPTGTAATFGAAVAAASLLALTSSQMLDALGNAGTQAAGLWEFNADGAMSKHLHAGKAAWNGILSADLAQCGFTGATRILEGERGFFPAMSNGHDPTRITDKLGTRWKISENCFKLYSCCGHTHSAIDTALDLRAQLGWTNREASEQVNRIEIDTYGPGFEIVKELNPRSPFRAKFSLAYVATAALLEGRVGLEQFSAERFDAEGVVDRSIAALLPRVRIAVSDQLTARYPAAWPARIRLTLQDGKVLSGGSDYPRGNPENPVSTAGLQQKFRALIEPRFGSGVADRSLDAVQEITHIGDMANAFSNLI
jgi:2-methylcitrate dehydratase PrpD